MGLVLAWTSGVITALGLMVGLYSGTHSRAAVLGGILTIAVADALSDAMGVHVSEEAENKHSQREVWASTFATVVSKFVFALTFAVPVLLLNLDLAVVVSAVWGLLLISVFSWRVARSRNEAPHKIIFEHIAIALAVVVLTHFVGDFVATLG